MRTFPLHQVALQDGIFEKAHKANLNFIKRIEPDRMLSGFRRCAGLSDAGASPYGGWEDSQIGGHAMGHYLIALAQEGVTGDEECLIRLNYIVHFLRECQLAHGNGFLFGAKLETDEYPEKQFDVEEEKVSGNSWVPWYTMHKILAGLLESYRLCKPFEALPTIVDLADWICGRVLSWDADTRRIILSKEYGGMSDVLYELSDFMFDLSDILEDANNADTPADALKAGELYTSDICQTKAALYQKAARIFDDTELLEKLSSGKKNTLNGLHANTLLPKLLGSLHHSKDESDILWNIIIEKHAYATGGISDMEHFFKDNSLDAHRTSCNCESCCSYNMLKLSHRLMVRNAKSGYKAMEKYADYTERLLFNAILGAIDPTTGGTAYFSPMATGYHKTFGSGIPDKSLFWCCNGTGMETYSKLQEEIYWQDGDTLIINQYISSVLAWDEKGIRLVMDVDYGHTGPGEFIINIYMDGATSLLELRMRLPRWIPAEAPTISTTDEGAYITRDGQYISITEITNSTLALKLTLNKSVKDETTKSSISGRKLIYRTNGPFVLAADLGTDDEDDLTPAGIDVYASGTKIAGGMKTSPPIVYGESHTVILPTEEYHPDLVFTEYYNISNERYGIYWYQ